MTDFLFDLGNFLTNLGIFFMPISFLAYVFLKFIELAKRPQVHITLLYKILWLSMEFIVEFSTERKYVVVIILLIFLEIIDLLFEFLEEVMDSQ